MFFVILIWLLICLLDLFIKFAVLEIKGLHEHWSHILHRVTAPTPIVLQYF